MPLRQGFVAQRHASVERDDRLKQDAKTAPPQHFLEVHGAHGNARGHFPVHPFGADRLRKSLRLFEGGHEAKFFMGKVHDGIIFKHGRGNGPAIDECAVCAGKIADLEIAADTGDLGVPFRDF